MMLTVPNTLFEMLIDQLQHELPREGCGFLAGIGQIATVHYPIDNLALGVTRYEMDPTQLVTALLDIEERELSLLAIYHSHPTGSAYPSETDIANAHYPEALQLIVSFTDRLNPTYGAYRLANDHVLPIPLKLIE